MLLSQVRGLIEKECITDRIDDDVTARLLGKEGKRAAVGLVRVREEGVFSGEVICAAFGELLGAKGRVVASAREGQTIRKGETVARIEAAFATCLSIERTLLNFLSHVCGVATLTSRFVRAVEPHRAGILATRKTLPGLRELQLLAVRAGGGFVHRRSLSDGILIKDNHLDCLGVTEILKRAKHDRSPLHSVEIEVQSLEALPRVLESPPDVIMLDNLSLDEMARALALIAGKSRVEASGGIGLDTVGAIAALGVDYISVGALTHSVRSLDLTLDIQKE